MASTANYLCKGSVWEALIPNCPRVNALPQEDIRKEIHPFHEVILWSGSPASLAAEQHQLKALCHFPHCLQGQNGSWTWTPKRRFWFGKSSVLGSMSGHNPGFSASWCLVPINFQVLHWHGFTHARWRRMLFSYDLLRCIYLSLPIISDI